MKSVATLILLALVAIAPNGAIAASVGPCYAAAGSGFLDVLIFDRGSGTFVRYAVSGKRTVGKSSMPFTYTADNDDVSLRFGSSKCKPMRGELTDKLLKLMVPRGGNRSFTQRYVAATASDISIWLNALKEEARLNVHGSSPLPPAERITSCGLVYADTKP